MAPETNGTREPRPIAESDTPGQPVFTPASLAPEVSAVIVSYNTCSLLLQCVEALTCCNDIVMDVWVVDNASSDGSADAVLEKFPEVRLIRNRTNRGFAAACNQGINQSLGKYILLVNSDAFVAPTLPRIVASLMEEQPTAGAVGCKLQNLDGSNQASCFSDAGLLPLVLEMLGLNARCPNNRFNRRFRMLEWDYDSLREVDCVAGACMVLRREAIAGIGGLDEAYFMYFEDFDWCRRARTAGWQVLYCPKARAIHLGGCSTARAKSTLGTQPLEALKRYIGSLYEHKPVTRVASLIMLNLLTGAYRLRLAARGGRER